MNTISMAIEMHDYRSRRILLYHTNFEVPGKSQKNFGNPLDTIHDNHTLLLFGGTVFIRDLTLNQYVLSKATEFMYVSTEKPSLQSHFSTTKPRRSRQESSPLGIVDTDLFSVLSIRTRLYYLHLSIYDYLTSYANLNTVSKEQFYLMA